MSESLPCVGRGELPIDSELAGVAVFVPSVCRFGDGRPSREAAGQALACEDTEFGFRPIQPTAVLGRVDQFQLAEERQRLGRAEGLGARGEIMRGQVVAHPRDPLRRGITSSS